LVLENNGGLILCHLVDSFVPGRLHTVCKKQVKREWSEALTYQALMKEPLCEVIPKFYREFEQDNERKLNYVSRLFASFICFLLLNFM